ncbi:MAG: molybdopterin molybdotransferase MoeA [Dehalococcoidales bacterium]|nr:molybdopterin molybdotransferase MoeA [Dehalococcoidales bacterium]
MKWTETLVSIDDALTLLLEQITPIERTEVLEGVEIPGRVLAQNLTATHNVPPFDRAAMDGYALNSADTRQASRQCLLKLPVLGELYAGDMHIPHIKPGTCIYIATGAALPAGADAVIRIEHTVVGDGCIEVDTPVRTGDNVAPSGEDIRAGDTVLKAGDWLSPARTGVLASQGLSSISVYEKPVISVITTGGELVQPPNELKSGQIYDVNNTTLCSLIQLHGGISVKMSGFDDSLESLGQSLEQALDADMVVVSGGSSVGEKDYIGKLLSSKGKIFFHGLNVKPGKPTLFAVVSGKPVLALPGYPTSCLIMAYLLLKPALRKLAHLPDYEANYVEAEFTGRVKASQRRQFVTVKLDKTRAIPVGKESGAITATADASGYVTVPENSGLIEGSRVKVRLF